MAGSAALILLMVAQAGHLPPSGQLRQDAGATTTQELPRQDAASTEPVRNDARLADVAFVDPQHGWAVGDRGTIWHTDDGGRHWGLQDSGVTCPLNSVFFLTPQIGWTAGGFAHPYLHTGSGVALWTQDGGRHWNRTANQLLPALRQVRFFSERQGWAVGCSSAMFPAGVFLTRDGGRSWQPLCGTGTAGWQTAGFFDARNGVLAGRSGAAVVRQSEIELARTGDLGLRGIARLQLVTPSHGWMVGSGGLVLLTGDQGATWQPPPCELPKDSAGLFDFAALAVRTTKCWIAGTPGSRVFHTPDAGRTWTAFATGCPLPIEALAFADDLHGWAVGALGTILATDDGGRTWRRQRSGGSRAALVGLVGQPEDIPLELFARLSGEEGYLGVAEVLGRRDVEVPSRDEAHAADRAHEALVAVGACGADTAWQFPLRQPGLRLTARQIVDGWDRASGAGNSGRVAMELHLVRQIRMWRPDVLVTHDADPRRSDPVEELICQAVLDAIGKAADPAWRVPQMTAADLRPWQVKKVFGILPPGVRGSPEVTTTQYSPRLGRSLADVVAAPRGLLEDHFRPCPATLGFRLLAGNTAGNATGAATAGTLGQPPTSAGAGPATRDLFSGLGLPHGGEARRALGNPPLQSLELLQRAAQRRRNAQAILDRADQDPQSAVRLLAQIDELTRGLDPAGAAQVIYQLADRYHRTGQWELAAETFQLLADRYGDDLLARPALLWLVQYYARAGASVAPAAPMQGRDGEGIAKTMLDRAVALGAYAERTRPDLFAEPALRFPLAAAYRKQGMTREAQRLYLAQARGGARDAWWSCAQGEAWLAQPKGPSPKPVLTCVATRQRPRLDGRLDDPVWQQAKSAALQSALHDDADWPAVVMFAHDDEFLYIAVSCRKAPGVKYEPAPTGPRPRDPDLSACDRVDILLDLDRTYATHCRLTIDHRGWAADSCWGDGTWNPNWFVAARTADGTWTAEAAIPLTQLRTGQAAKPTQPPEGDASAGGSARAREVWAVGIQRTVPGIGFQSWNTPASTTTIPEGFGYLMLE
jgi:photosystem II stability/assembly factor-like uncharacterized protein